MPDPYFQPGQNPANAEWGSIKQDTSKMVALRELRKLQVMVLDKAVNAKTEEVLRPAFVRSYLELRTQIRIEHGIIKPGSRNISVREEPKGQSLPKIDQIAVMNEMREAAKQMGIATPRVEIEQTQTRADGTTG